MEKYNDTTLGNRLQFNKSVLFSQKVRIRAAITTTTITVVLTPNLRRIIFIETSAIPKHQTSKSTVILGDLVQITPDGDRR